MKPLSHISNIPQHAEQPLSLTYEELITKDEDLGYKTTINEKGVHHHQITRSIVASINQLTPGGHMKNIIYTPAEPFSVELTNSELSYKYNDFFQVSYIMSGKIFYHIHDTDITAEEGSILLIDDNTYYCENTISSNGTIINISISPEVINDIFTLQNSEDNLQGFLHRSFIKEKKRQNMLYYLPKTSDKIEIMTSLISALLFELKSQNKGYELICKGYLLRLLDYIAFEYNYSYTEEEKMSFRKYLFSEVRQYMFQHYQNIQLQDLISHFHYQRNYFNHLIKEFTGLTYSDYLIEIRLIQARHLLETTRLSVDEIISKVGYNNKGFFYKNFKKSTGLSPALYRKSSKNKT